MARHSPVGACLLCGPLALVANGVPPDTLSYSALLASPIAVAGLLRAVPIPRMPGIVFYAFYPAHLYALFALGRWA